MKIDLAERCAAGWVRAPPHVRRGTTTQCTSQCARAFSTNTHVISPCARPTHHTRAHHPKRHPRAIRHLHRPLASSSQHCFLVLLSQRHPHRADVIQRAGFIRRRAHTHTVRASYPPGHGPRPSPNRIAASTRRRPSPPWRTPRTHPRMRPTTTRSRQLPPPPIAAAPFPPAAPTATNVFRLAARSPRQTPPPPPRASLPHRLLPHRLPSPLPPRDDNATQDAAAAAPAATPCRPTEVPNNTQPPPSVTHHHPPPRHQHHPHTPPTPTPKNKTLYTKTIYKLVRTRTRPPHATTRARARSRVRDHDARTPSPPGRRLKN